MPLTRLKFSVVAIFLVATGVGAQTTEPSLPYVVKPRDTVIGVAKRNLADPGRWNEVARYNRMPDPNVIRPGQTVQIPLRLMKPGALNGRVVAAQGEVLLSGAPATVGAAVPEGARLQTGVNSSAVVELADGSRVKVLPSSLAEITSQREYALRDAAASGSATWFSGVVRLAQGALETVVNAATRRAEPFRVQTPTSLVGVRGTEFRVAYEDPVARNARTEVTAGLVRADNPAQASGADLARGEGAVIDPNQREVRVVKLLPAPDLSGLPPEVLKPAGTWPLPALAGAQAFRVQVAADPQFNGIVRDIKVAGAAGASVNLASLADGNWQVRVRGIDGVGLEGFDAVRQIAVRTFVPAPSRWRAGAALLRFDAGQTVLQWEATAADGQPLAAREFALEIAADAGFTRELRRITSTQPRAALGALPAGSSWFVRLRATAADGRALEGQTYRFEVPGNWGLTVLDSAVTLHPAP